MTKRQKTICARLGQDQPYGPTDVCGLPSGHAGPHHGKYRRMVWEDVAGKPHRARIHSPGSLTGNMEDTGGNIRGN